MVCNEKNSSPEVVCNVTMTNWQRTLIVSVIGLFSYTRMLWDNFVWLAYYLLEQLILIMVYYIYIYIQRHSTSISFYEKCMGAGVVRVRMGVSELGQVGGWVFGCARVMSFMYPNSKCILLFFSTLLSFSSLSFNDFNLWLIFLCIYTSIIPIQLQHGFG